MGTLGNSGGDLGELEVLYHISWGIGVCAIGVCRSLGAIAAKWC